MKQSRERWAEHNKEKIKEIHKIYRLRKDHDITYEQFHELIIHQSGLCAICQKELKSPNVDHDHKNGKIRGLLCRKCNMALGLFEDNINALRNAITYLSS